MLEVLEHVRRCLTCLREQVVAGGGKCNVTDAMNLTIFGGRRSPILSRDYIDYVTPQILDVLGLISLEYRNGL